MFTEEQKHLLDKLSTVDDIGEELRKILSQTKRQIQELNTVSSDIHRIIEEKTKGFPWLADAISQYIEFCYFLYRKENVVRIKLAQKQPKRNWLTLATSFVVSVFGLCRYIYMGAWWKQFPLR